MQLTISFDNDNLIQVQVEKETSIEDLKSILEVDTQISALDQILIYHARQLQDSKKVGDYQIEDGDVLVLQKKINAGSTQQAQQGALQHQDGQQSNQNQQGQSQFSLPMLNLEDDNKVNQFIQMLKLQPGMLNIIRQQNPRLADAMQNNNIDQVKQFIRQFQQQQMGQQFQQSGSQNYGQYLDDELSRLERADSMDVGAQRRIEELIKQKNIQSNIDLAFENTPESFFQVHMLFVNLKVNNYNIKAFIDSGAQATIMSQACAEKCNLMHLVDTRMAGIAVGVGTAKFLGKVHAAYLQVNNEVIQASINILEGSNKPDFIFGLDMLRRHQCCIDMKKNELIFGSCDIALPFLSEHEASDEFQFQREQLMKAKGSTLEEGQLTGKATINGQTIPSTNVQSRLPQQKAQNSAGQAQQSQSSQQQLKQYQEQQRQRQTSQGQTQAQGQIQGQMQGQTQSQGQVQTQGLAQNDISNEKIKVLTDLGFNHQQSIQALQACQGNVEQAAAMLFQ